MEHSESIKELAAALAKAQGEMKAAEMTATNPFLKNKYADLGEIIKAGKAPLANNGLAIVQPVSNHGDEVTVETVLMHQSGEWISEKISAPATKESGISSVQSAGKIITYLRRYSYASMLGIYGEEDDDGNENQKPERRPAAQAKAPEQPKQPQTPPPAKPAPAEQKTNGMTIETALAWKDKKGRPFGMLSYEELEAMLEKAKKAPSEVKTPEFLNGIHAIELVLEHLEKQDEAARQAMNE